MGQSKLCDIISSTSIFIIIRSKYYIFNFHKYKCEKLITTPCFPFIEFPALDKWLAIKGLQILLRRQLAHFFTFIIYFVERSLEYKFIQKTIYLSFMNGIYHSLKGKVKITIYFHLFSSHLLI